MNNIVTFFPGSPTWREISEKKYKKIFDHDLAILYLKHEVNINGCKIEVFDDFVRIKTELGLKAVLAI